MVKYCKYSTIYSLYIWIYICFISRRSTLCVVLSLILAPEEPTAHPTALWLSINPASMKSQGANAEKRANLPVYTISSYTDALVPALQNNPSFFYHQHQRPLLHPPSNMFAEVFMLNKVIVSSGPTLPFVLLLLLKPVSSCVTPNSGEVWKMEEGNHAKWTYSPACRKITGGWTISHSLLPTELQISHLHKQKVTRNLTKEQNKEEIILRTNKKRKTFFFSLQKTKLIAKTTKSATCCFI